MGSAARAGNTAADNRAKLHKAAVAPRETAWPNRAGTKLFMYEFSPLGVRA
jgi:hypothetical protein